MVPGRDHIARQQSLLKCLRRRMVPGGDRIAFREKFSKRSLGTPAQESGDLSIKPKSALSCDKRRLHNSRCVHMGVN